MGGSVLDRLIRRDSQHSDREQDPRPQEGSEETARDILNAKNAFVCSPKSILLGMLGYTCDSSKSEASLSYIWDSQPLSA